jgi:hypothetical protein
MKDKKTTVFNYCIIFGRMVPWFPLKDGKSLNILRQRNGLTLNIVLDAREHLPNRRFNKFLKNKGMDKIYNLLCEENLRRDRINDYGYMTHIVRKILHEVR